MLAAILPTDSRSAMEAVHKALAARYVTSRFSMVMAQDGRTANNLKLSHLRAAEAIRRVAPGPRSARPIRSRTAGPCRAGSLASMKQAMNEGCVVHGCVHWSALDNWEWLEGYRATFGLIGIDCVTLERHPKPSLAWLAGRRAPTGHRRLFLWT
ncbi:family 1 glycosylhydrolase [Novosphingobium profundi]|nr:family 1 glycosylhydrolase [Novosphingobium profundi]